MNKKILLGAAISLASLQVTALPFAPTDARSMAMGGTGVSSAEVASTVQFNPALLANTREDDHFGLIIPQFGISIADDGGFIDEVEDFDEESPNAPGSGQTNIDLLDQTLTDSTGSQGLEKMAAALSDLDTAATSAQYDAANLKLTQAIGYLDGKLFIADTSLPNNPDLVLHSTAVANDLDDLNNKSLRLNLGGNIALAVPSKKFSMALSAGGQAVFSGRVIVASEDTDILRNYSSATASYIQKVATLKDALDDIDPTTPTLGQIQAVADAQGAVNEFNFGGNQTGTSPDEGETAIFTNGELVANEATLNSQVQMVGVATADLGLTVSRIFNIKEQDIAIGITPKLQKVTIFDYTQDLDGEDENGNPVEFDSDAITESTEEYTSFNLDIGAAYQFGAEKQFQAGLVIKNLLGKDYESAPYAASNGAEGTIVSVSPMVRAGISHKTNWTKVAFDLDLTENDPVAFEDATQYASLGAELNVFRFVQLRGGYRANLAASGQDVMTAGIGLSPFAIHIDIGVMANTSDPENEAGLAFEFGIEF